MIPAIIPARGGSKGIPRKNLVEVAGKPLIVWSIEQALAAELVDEVVVTTDDAEIARVADSHGARTFRRSPATATDDASSESALLEVIDANYRRAECIVFLQATSPCRQPGDIDRAIKKFRSTKCDSLFSARVIHGYTWRDEQGNLMPNYHTRERRQELKTERLEENGSIYIFKPLVLIATNNRLEGKIACYRMSPLDSLQIDEPSDIPLLEQVLTRDCHRTLAN